LKNNDKSPFNYGIRDLLTIGVSGNNIEDFKIKCEEIIKALEPRVSEFEITDIKQNIFAQSLEFSIKCVLKGTKEKFHQKILTC
jgi:predicted component of type VI protein secretion system